MKVGNWVIKPDLSGGFDIYNEALGLALKGCRPLSKQGDWELLPNGLYDFAGQKVVFGLDDKLQMELEFSSKEPRWFEIATKIRNLSLLPIQIGDITSFSCTKIESSELFDRCLTNGNDMCEISRVSSEKGSFESHCVVGFTDAKGSSAFAMGFTDLREAFYRFLFNMSEGISSLKAICDREGVELPAGQELAISTLALGAGESMSLLMDEYASQTAAIMGYRDTKIATGWCSWYYYYDTATEQDIDCNIEAIAASAFKDKIRVIQIDDGWNLPDRDALHVWGDWYAGKMFPRGMKDLADRIKQKGFVPGLWLAPFSIDPASRFHREHPDWLIGKKGKPLDFWGVSGLDLSHPEALRFVRETFERVFNEWGFDYVKIDFLLHAVLKGDRFDNGRTTAALLRDGLKVIRQVAGDRFILCCGCPMGPAIGVCDGMRVGYDVSSRWDVRVNPQDWPLGNLNIRAAALQSAWRQWMHKRWWKNDPDCLVVRDYGSAAEKKMFAKNFPDFEKSPPYGLTDEEVTCWSQFVWFTGGMAMVSENMAELSGDRYELLAHNFPPHSEPVRWVDWYHDPEVVVMQSISRKMVGIFNFSEKPVALSIPADKLFTERRWSFVERLSQQHFEGNGDIVKFPELLAHAGCVWIQV